MEKVPSINSSVQQAQSGGRISLPSELCDLDKDLDIHAKNYHFAEIYKENRILFDYKLKEGRCTTTNARYLLRMAGILK